MKQLAIIGASGHGKVVADIASLCGYDEIVFLDDDRSKKTCGAYSVVGTSEDVAGTVGDLFVAVGNAAIRKSLMERFGNRNYPTLVHPRAVVAETAVVGKGTVVMAGAVINPDSRIGRGCIVNTCASVDHDCKVGDYVHVSVGAHLCGTVSVGEGTWIGAGAVVSNNLSVCGNCTIGAGAVVVRDILEAGIYVGVPAQVRKGERARGGGYGLALSSCVLGSCHAQMRRAA